MKQALMVAVTCVITATVSVAISWRLASRRIEEVRDESEQIARTYWQGNSKSLVELAGDIHDMRERLDRVDAYVTTTTQRATVVAPRAASAPRPTSPSANWWCYFGRECFRKRDECSGGDSARTDECKATRSAWCTGVDGHECFANFTECLEINAREAASFQVYGSGVGMPRECVEVE